MRRSPPLLGATAALLLAAGCSASGDDQPGVAKTVPPASVTAVAISASPTSDQADTSGSVASTNPMSTSSIATTSTSTSTPATTSSVPAAADAIAAEITAAERGIRDGSLSMEAVDGFGRRQQRAYQLLARHTDLQDEVAASIPADVAEAFLFNVAARDAVAAHAAGNPPTEPSPTLPAWTILEPRPIDELLADYHEAEVATGVPWEYLAAINLVETRMGRISGGSSAGALGPMQFLPETWAACCTGDIEDPHDAILGAATYLVSEGAPGDMRAALYRYNPNEGYVGAVTAYASNLMADPLSYRGYHAWEVYVGSAAGTVRLPVGYAADQPIDAFEYVRTHPDAAAG